MKRFECHSCGHSWLAKSLAERGSACPNCNTEATNVKGTDVPDDHPAGMQPLNRPANGKPEIKPVVAVKGPKRGAKRRKGK